MATGRFNRPSTAQPHSRGDKFSVVAAIDFGTTYSGYAFSHISDKNDIKMNKPWGSGLGITTYKAPTCLLADDKDQFVAFGYDAFNKFTKDTISNVHHFYDRIKMELYKEKVVSTKTTVISKSGRVCSAEIVISLILRYLYEHIIETLQKSNLRNVDDKQIKWVLTVPAIWSDGGKQLMRRAAWKAGLIDSLASRRLLIALEPESASYWCRTLPLDQFTQRSCEDKTVENELLGTYMVVDCGGGTVDITVHNKTADGKIREIYRATGGDWGATRVEDGIIEILNKIFGKSYLLNFKLNNPKDWIKLVLLIETTKRSISTIPGDLMNISLSYKFISTACKIKGKAIENLVKNAQLTGVTFNEDEGTLDIGGRALQQVFNSVIDKVFEHLDHLLSITEMENVKLMYLVGGFSECEVLQRAIKKRFGGKMAILVPQDAGIAVLKGAVLYGHDPFVIVSRIARRTYGMGGSGPFKHGVHDPNKLFVNEEGNKRCNHLFHICVKKGESVKTGEIRILQSYPSRQDQTIIHRSLYMTDKNNVMYNTEAGVRCVGKLKINAPDTHIPRKERILNNYVYFGGTEIHVQFEDTVREDGDTDETTIDFLAD